MKVVGNCEISLHWRVEGKTCLRKVRAALLHVSISEKQDHKNVSYFVRLQRASPPGVMLQPHPQREGREGFGYLTAAAIWAAITSQVIGNFCRGGLCCFFIVLSSFVCLSSFHLCQPTIIRLRLVSFMLPFSFFFVTNLFVNYYQAISLP